MYSSPGWVVIIQMMDKGLGQILGQIVGIHGVSPSLPLSCHIIGMHPWVSKKWHQTIGGYNLPAFGRSQHDATRLWPEKL